MARPVLFAPLEFLARLAALVLRPRTNVIRFHGVYAAHARLRAHVVPAQKDEPCGCGPGRTRPGTSRLPWSELLARVFLAIMSVGWAFSVVIETPVLMLALPEKVPMRRRIAAGIWLTSASYPLFVCLLPLLSKDIVVLETMVIFLECLLYHTIVRPRALRGEPVLGAFLAIAFANVASCVATFIVWSDH